jgi:hypothetical protein
MTVIPTLAREEAMFVFGDEPGFTDNPFFQKGLTPERLALLKTKKRGEQAGDPARPNYRRAFEIDKINVKKLADAGVRIVFGTDSGGDPNRYFIQGFFEHRRWWSRGGAHAMQPSSFSGRLKRSASTGFGTLPPPLAGADENPLDDIANMRTIEAVYLGGQCSGDTKIRPSHDVMFGPHEANVVSENREAPSRDGAARMGNKSRTAGA